VTEETDVWRDLSALRQALLDAGEQEWARRLLDAVGEDVPAAGAEALAACLTALESAVALRHRGVADALDRVVRVWQTHTAAAAGSVRPRRTP
jgi:hypothetical protein